MKTSTKIERPRDDTATRRQTTPPIPGFSPRSEDAIAHRLRNIAPQRIMLVAGMASTLIYLAFVAAFPITRWWNHPHTNDLAANINDMGRITGYSPFAAVGFVSAILALFLCQFLAMTAANRVQREEVEARVARFVRRALFGFPLLFGAIMVWMQPVTTTDLYGYVARGYLFARLHLNPMTTPASLLPGGLTVNRPAAPYGPAWLLVAGALSALSGDNLLLNMLAFKVIGLLAVAASIWLVDSLARRLCPDRRLRVMALFAWSPLLIFESVGNGHNDIVMVGLVLAALALMLRDRPRWALACLVLGALVKYESAIFVPLWLVYEVRRRLALPKAAATATAGGEPPHVRIYRRVRDAIAAARQADLRRVAPLLASASAIGLALLVAFYAPFWDGLHTFTGLGQQLRPLYYNSSLVGFISGPLQIIVPSQHDAALDKTLRLIFYTLFFIYAYIQTVRLWRVGQRITLDDVVSAAAKITFAALLLITFWFQPWYVVWLLPLAALSREPFIRRQGTLFAAGALLSYAVGNFLFVNDPGQDVFVQFFEILMVFGPLLLLRAAPYEQGYAGILRRYLGAFGEGLRLRPVFWERVMLVLIVMVGALLRIVQLGNIFATLPTTTSEGNLLNQISGDLRLGLVDPQGLAGPFVFVEALLVRVFGRTPLAYLLPSAVIGSVTVIALYLLTYEIMRLGNFPGRRPVAILAALFAATSRWHVSLSRSGMEVVLLPLLMCLAVYWLLRALHPPTPVLTASATAAARTPPVTIADDSLPTPTAEADTSAATPPPPAQGRRRQLVSYAACGICTGLACDVAPGMWLVPLIVLGFLAIWQWRRPKGHGVTRAGLLTLAGMTLITGLPVVWHFLSPVVGFPVGSGLLARTSVQQIVGPGPLTPTFWGQVGHNALDVLKLLATQDYTAGYPANGGAPIIPALLGPAFYLGLLLVIWRWRRFESLALLLLVALPLAASIAVGTPTGIIEAASILPAMCILPAFALYAVGEWLSHLPIVFDRVNGVRVFASPEQIGRLLLLLFLVVSTIRTFFWYFEASLPAHQPQWTPSFVPSHLVQMGAALYARTADVAGVRTAWVTASATGTWSVATVL
ncbi:MAG TPA: polyprenol phosphomannose-dependent alpha 1,6 mannosyltransferase MptB [Ktedonobacterales bacterium]